MRSEPIWKIGTLTQAYLFALTRLQASRLLEKWRAAGVQIVHNGDGFLIGDIDEEDGKMLLLIEEHVAALLRGEPVNPFKKD